MTECKCKSPKRPKHWTDAVRTIAAWTGIVAVVYLVVKCKTGGL